jgi:predicted Zn-dependent protease
MGHEIGHVVQHHMARMMAQRKNDSLISLAGMALAILSARANPQLANAAMTASMAGSVQKQLDYTRDHEREADRVGITILESAGYDTHGMASFFKTMQKGTRYVEGSAPGFLRTHPITSERIADVTSRISNNKYRMLPYSPDFDLVRAKILATSGIANQAVALFQSNLQDRRYSSESAQHYGLAIAMLRLGNVDGASKELGWLRANSPSHTFYASLAANIEVARDKPSQAAKVYQAGLAVYPGSRALIDGYAEHFLRIRQAPQALQLLNEKQSLYPDYPYMYELKSKAYAMQGKSLLSHQAQGEAYFRRYNIPKAVEQMDLAVKAGDGDFYQQSIVEARLKELRALVDDPKKSNWFN